MADLTPWIRDVPDFPKEGIVFKDISPLLGDPKGFGLCMAELEKLVDGVPCDKIAGIESRGFLFGAALAMCLGVGFIPVRKPGKLPWKTVRQEYSLEYGTDAVEMHVDAVEAGQDVLVVDDLIEKVGGRVSALSFVVALDFIPWRDKIGDRDVRALLRYS